MIALAKRFRILELPGPHLLFEHLKDKVIALERGGLLFMFNFHPTRSYENYSFEVLPGKYRMIFESDASEYGGHGRLLADQYHLTLPDTSRGKERHLLSLYLPTRTANSPVFFPTCSRINSYSPVDFSYKNEPLLLFTIQMI